MIISAMVTQEQAMKGSQQGAIMIQVWVKQGRHVGFRAGQTALDPVEQAQNLLGGQVAEIDGAGIFLCHCGGRGMVILPD